MSRVVISGYYGFENLGDEAILAGIISSLRQQERGIKIVVLSNRPELTAERFQLSSVYRNNLKTIIREIRKSDLFISGGGSLLQDVTSWRSIPYYLGLVFLAQVLGKKTVFYAQGIGPIRGRLGKTLVRLIGNRTDLITVRDINSKELLIKLGVKSKLIKTTIDPVFSLQNKEWQGNSQLFREAGIEKNRPLIGISVRPWGNNSYLEKLAKGADFLANLTGGEVVIVPMHYYQDQGVSIRLKNLMKNKARVLKGNYTPLEMIGIFAGLDFLIGVRLHSLIFAVINNLPFVAISYDPKIDSFLKTLGIDGCLDINHLTSDSLERIIKANWLNRKGFISTLEKENLAFYKMAINNAEMVLGLMNK